MSLLDKYMSSLRHQKYKTENTSKKKKKKNTWYVSLINEACKKRWVLVKQSYWSL